MAKPDDEGPPPLSGATDSDINRLVDDVLRSGKHLTMPAEEAANVERYHARVIAAQMQRLAEGIAKEAAGEGADRDEWWFEVHGRRIGPISLKKIRLLWEDGELTPDSLCWHEGFPKWVSLFKVSELAQALTPKLEVNVDAAAAAFSQDISGEWASPASTAIEESNRRKLQSTQLGKAPVDPLPLSTPVNLADERAATYTTLQHHIGPRDEADEDEEEERPRARSGFGNALVTGVVAGVIAAVAIFAARLLLPSPVVQPIVLTVMGGGAPAPVAAVPAPVPAPEPVKPEPVKPEPVKPEPVKPAPAPKPAEAVAKPPAAPKPAAAKEPAQEPEEPKKPATVEEAFANAFKEMPPDELTTGEVFEVVRAHKAASEACAEAQRAATPEASGKLVMRWTVEPDGSVSDVSATGEMSKSTLAECLAKEIATWTFPKHALAHPPVEFPFKY